MYNQECHYGFLAEAEERVDNFIASQGGKMVFCHNSLCPEKYCKFSFFTGGMIPDSECLYFGKNERNKVK